MIPLFDPFVEVPLIGAQRCARLCLAWPFDASVNDALNQNLPSFHGGAIALYSSLICPDTPR
jgi:hypothetical protein